MQPDLDCTNTNSDFGVKLHFRFRNSSLQKRGDIGENQHFLLVSPFGGSEKENKLKESEREGEVSQTFET